MTLKRIAFAWVFALIGALAVPFLRHGIVVARDQGDSTTAVTLIAAELVLAVVIAAGVAASIAWEAFFDE